VLDQPATFTGAVSNFGAQNGIDFSQLGFFGNTLTLGFAENGAGTGGVLSVSNGAQTASVTLLGNYIAASFVTASDEHGGTLVSEAPHAQTPVLTQPHA
jgi:hypothetical protein